MFYSIEFRRKEEIKKDGKPYRLWWNNISEQTQFPLFRDYKTKALKVSDRYCRNVLIRGFS